MTMIALATPRPRVSVDRTAPFLWYTLSVNSHAQKWVCQRAKELEIETYVPVKREPPEPSSARKSRSVDPVVERPLMPGYVFVSLETAAPRFDLFQPFDQESDRPAPLPADAAAGYVADYAQPAVEPIWGCRGFLSGSDGPMPVHEAVIEDMRLRERNGEFDLTARTDSGRGFVARWVKRGVTVNFVDGPFRLYFGVIDEVLSSTLIKVGVMIFGRITVINAPLDWIRRVG